MTATGNNYAESLFMLACEENAIDEFFDGLKLVEGVLKEAPEYLQFLSTPSIPKSERTAALESAFKAKINDHVLSFLQLLCEQSQAECFFECVAEFARLREMASNTAVAVVKTAVALEDAQKAALTAALQQRTGKKVTLNCVIDNTLLGGISVEIDGKLLDGSVKTNLKRAREVISE